MFPGLRIMAISALIPLSISQAFHLHCILSLLVLRIVNIAGWVLYTRLLHPLASISGPLVASLTRFWLVHNVKQGSFDQVARHLHKKYGITSVTRSYRSTLNRYGTGPLVRIAPNEVSVSDPEAVGIIYGIKSKFTKVGLSVSIASSYIIRCVDRFL